MNQIKLIENHNFWFFLQLRQYVWTTQIQRAVSQTVASVAFVKQAPDVILSQVKHTKLAISKVALLTPCMEFEIFCGQMPSFEVLWMCHYQTFFYNVSLNLFQIQYLCQFWSKSGFSQKDTNTAFSFLFLVFFYHVSII